MQISQTIHYSMAAPVRFYYSITTHTPAVLPVLIVYGLYTTSNPFEVIIQSLCIPLLLLLYRYGSVLITDCEIVGGDVLTVSVMHAPQLLTLGAHAQRGLQ